MRDIEQDRKRVDGWDQEERVPWRAIEMLRDYMEEVEHLRSEVERLTAPKPQPLGIPGYCIECGLTMEKCWDYGCGHTE